MTRVENITLETLDKRIIRNDEIIASEMDDEVIMMSLAHDAYFALDPVGSRIWALLAQPMSAKEICDQLMEEYDVTPNECQTQTLAFLQTLAEKELIQAAI